MLINDDDYKKGVVREGKIVMICKMERAQEYCGGGGVFYEKKWLKRPFQRIMDTIIFLLLLLLLAHRLISLLTTSLTVPCFFAFLCESWFTLAWSFILSTKWTPAFNTTNINSLLHRYTYYLIFC